MMTTDNSKEEMSNENWARGFVALLMDEVRKDVSSQVIGGSRSTNVTLEIYSRKLAAKLDGKWTDDSQLNELEKGE